MCWVWPKGFARVHGEGDFRFTGRERRRDRSRACWSQPKDGKRCQKRWRRHESEFLGEGNTKGGCFYESLPIDRTRGQRQMNF